VRLFEDERYAALAAANAEAYRGARPFPHVVLDDFLPEATCRALLAEFPGPDAIAWRRFERHHSVKLATRGDLDFPPVAAEVLQAFNGAAFLRFLETLTGVEGLVPDPHFVGGGLHQILPGGHLKVHADFNTHPTTGLARRLNALLYLNDGWRDEWGGALELWERDMSRRAHAIAPRFNRLVVFSTSDTSFHGHPEPLACPPGHSRKSLALYYYTLGRPAEEGAEAAHGTLWQERPPERRPGLARRAGAAVLRNAGALLARPGEALRRLADRLAPRRR
jgi:hypothetical protein